MAHGRSRGRRTVCCRQHATAVPPAGLRQSAAPAPAASTTGRLASTASRHRPFPTASAAPSTAPCLTPAPFHHVHCRRAAPAPFTPRPPEAPPAPAANRNRWQRRRHPTIRRAATAHRLPSAPTTPPEEEAPSAAPATARGTTSPGLSLAHTRCAGRTLPAAAKGAPWSPSPERTRYVRCALTPSPCELLATRDSGTKNDLIRQVNSKPQNGAHGIHQNLPTIERTPIQSYANNPNSPGTPVGYPMLLPHTCRCPPSAVTIKHHRLRQIRCTVPL